VIHGSSPISRMSSACSSSECYEFELQDWTDSQSSQVFPWYGFPPWSNFHEKTRKERSERLYRKHGFAISCLFVLFVIMKDLRNKLAEKTGIRTLDTLRYTRFPQRAPSGHSHLSGDMASLFDLTHREGWLHGACASMFCFTLALDRRSKGTPWVR